jgi:hypothetical protein
MTIEAHNGKLEASDNEPQKAAESNNEPPPTAIERKATGPNPWLSIWISLVALLVAGLSLGVNYFRSNDPPNAIIVTADVKKQLNGFYVEGHEFYRRTIGLKRDVSLQEFQKLDTEVDDWSRRMGDFIEQKLGAAEKGRMLDVTGIPVFRGDGTY